MLSRTGHSNKIKLTTSVWRTPFIQVAATALLYFVIARFSLSLIINPEGIAAIWPPTGIFLSAILLSQRNVRPYLVGVLFLTDLSAELLAGTPFLVSALYSLALAGDAVFSSWLLLHFIRDPFNFRSIRDVLGFLLLSVVLSNSLMSLIAAASTRLIPGTSFWMTWVWWAASAGIGNLLITPLILSWSEIRKTGLAAWNSKQAIEEFIVLVFIALLNFFAFHFLSENNQFGLLLTYLNFPFLLWAALRLDLQSVTLALVFLAGVAIYSAITGNITTLPFSGNQFDAVFGLQLYLLIMAIPSLLLVVDVMVRKRTESTLRENNERFRHLAENIKDVFWIHDAKTGQVEYVSPAYERIWGRTPEDLYDDVSNWVEAIHSDDKNRVFQAFKDRDNNGTYDVEYRIVKPDHITHWIHDRGFPVFDDVGHPYQWVGVAEDITERKQAEEALRERNYYIDTILENAPIGFAVNRIGDGIGIFVSSKFDAIYGVPRGRMNTVDEYFEQAYLDPIFREQIRARIMTDMASGDPARMIWEDLPITTHTGAFKVVTAINIPLFEQGLMISTVQDVTKRWRAEEEKRHEAMRAEALARTAARLIAQMDFETVTAIVCEEAARALNAPAAFLFLYDPQRNIFSIAADFGLPTAYRDHHQALPEAVYGKLISHYGAEGIILSAQEMHNALAVLPVPDLQLHTIMAVNILHGSERIGVLCVASNEEAGRYAKEDLDLIQGIANQAAQAITRERLFEQVSTGRKHLQTLSKRLLEVQESERRTLALELHDELGQLLNSAKMSLDMITNLPPEAAEAHLHRAQDLVSDLVTRVREMALQLRPSMLDDMGLLPALSWLFKNYQLQTGKAVAFKETNMDQRFPPQVEITAYRIIQEALTNIIRHAGDDKQVRVEIWVDENTLDIQVRDRGKGFIPAEALGKHESSGLSGMRERARLLGGELIIESAPGAGTNLSASLPLGMPLLDLG